MDIGSTQLTAQMNLKVPTEPLFFMLLKKAPFFIYVLYIPVNKKEGKKTTIPTS